MRVAYNEQARSGRVEAREKFKKGEFMEPSARQAIQKSIDTALPLPSTAAARVPTATPLLSVVCADRS